MTNFAPATNYVFAYDPSLYECMNVEQMYLTLSGGPTENREQLSKEELFRQHLDAAFERSCQFIKFIKTDSGEEFFVGNVHLDLSNKHREVASNMLCERVAGIDKPMMLVGDFNQFDARIPEPVIFMDQVEIYKRHGFTWASEDLLSKGMKATFVAFPYDINRFLTKEDFIEYDRLKEQKDYDAIREFFVNKFSGINPITTCLDSVFTKNIALPEEKTKPPRCKAMMFSHGERVKPIPDEKAIKKMAVESELPSDHLPVLAKVRI